VEFLEKVASKLLEWRLSHGGGGHGPDHRRTFVSKSLNALRRPSRRCGWHNLTGPEMRSARR
jgi:hypothetical protein